MFRTNLNNEYSILTKDYNFTEAELEQISLNGIRASCLNPREKQQYIQQEFRKLT